jgi:hypothetical protein
MRPNPTRAQIRTLLESKGHRDAGLWIVGIRGYHAAPGANARGRYDDAIIVYSPTKCEGYTANTDPSAYRPKIAKLKAGLWLYKPGIHGLSKPAHRRYPALVQALPVTVLRDGQAKADTGYFGINIHRGGRYTTSSLGCQTIHPDQWEAFYASVLSSMRTLGLGTVRYLLVDGP